MAKTKELIMRKVGGFFHAFDEDAYILNYLFGYKISNSRLGFPVSSKNKVKNVLDEKKINYCFKISDEEIDRKDFKKLNRYHDYVKKGKNNYEIEKQKEKLKDKIKDLPLEKVEDILSYIEKVINE